MTDLRIPGEHRRGLGRLYNLSDSEAGELLASIKVVVSKEQSDDLAASQFPEVAGLSTEQLAEILDTLVALYGVRISAEVSIEEFIVDICEALQSHGSQDFQLPPESVERFSSRLKKFLSIDALNRAAKARVLRYEHERTFCTARIFTDARPVFEDAVGRPEATVIFHMLKIAYHEAGDVKEIYVSLDENDLDELRDVIKRAELKSKALKEALNEGRLKVVTTV